MERIKVDTTVLREKSKGFETSAGVYAQAGSELLSFVAGLPSYDGQLSGPARASALEMNRQCQELHECLLSDAQSLTRTAQAFEEVDSQTINALAENQAALVNQMPYYEALYAPVEKTRGGSDEIGYQFISDDYVVIWFKDHYMRIHLAVPPLSSADYVKVMNFIGFINAFDTDKQGMRDDVIAVWEAGGTGLILMITAFLAGGPIVGGLAAITAGITAILGQCKYGGDELLKFIDRVSKYGQAIQDFEELIQSNDSGIEIVTSNP
jgi:uncharacterized protein YukE